MNIVTHPSDTGLAAYAVVLVRSVLAIGVTVASPPTVDASKLVCAVKLPIRVGAID